MIDHITLRVREVGRSARFYRQALSPLGYVVKVRHGETIGFGVEDGTPRSDFYVSPMRDAPTGESTDVPESVCGSVTTHIAFRARNADEVGAFHRAALAAEGIDNGAPGPRSYHPGYYAAFVIDPDGNNIEAVVDWSWRCDS
ncbi:VOC family protein [uncultured Bifidobacterium sp.]|uniref:VOC family protein n=1 Tax=uncultured Bifidobacterium sp. TaxID=165187 RepID=UPI002616106A|nr:VOC family protein [uncultured Bifidobacterium sp.]